MQRGVGLARAASHRYRLRRLLLKTVSRIESIYFTCSQIISDNLIIDGGEASALARQQAAGASKIVQWGVALGHTEQEYKTKPQCFTFL